MQVIFKPEGYTTDDGTLSYSDIYNLEFDHLKPDDPGLLYLSRIAGQLIDIARRDPDIELTRVDGYFFIWSRQKKKIFHIQQQIQSVHSDT